MFHTRSVSDPPLSPTTLGPMESFASFSRPTTPSPAAPHNAQAYVKRPLPPLPPPSFNPGAIPPPLNIRKSSSKPPSLPLGPGAPSRPVSNEAPLPALPRREARSVSPLPAPDTPVKGSNPLHLSTISSNNSSPVHTLKPRKSKKVLQLMGHDIDVMNVVGVAPPEQKREPPVLRSSRSLEGAPNLNATTLVHLPEEILIPVLEDDDGRDSMSSKKSSWGPGSPHSASRLPLGPKQSVRRRRSARIFDQDDTGHLAIQETIMSNLDLNDDDEELQSEEDMTMEEYHKFASELAHSSARKPSHEESRPTTATQGRRSSILSFTHGRLRRKPTTSEPRHGRLGSSSSSEHPSQAPPAPAAPEAAEDAVPKSGWDSDSDSEDDRTSRSIWPRGRSSNNHNNSNNNKGRDSPASMTRHDDDARGSRGWAKGGLLNVGKRRKEQHPAAPRDFGGLDERSFA
ncbi:hypothetical protein ACQKWADRAFT_8075 [Trichoderma austrokoningii]